jgi:nitrite reductase/ring-hydroxylating ferredoxin subunit
MSPDHPTPWQPACPLEDLPDGDVWPVRVAGRELAMFRQGHEVFATDIRCTHGEGRLCDGFVEDGTIECPLHQGRFDIRTGRALGPPLEHDLRTYPARIEGGQVLVQVPRGGADPGNS